MKKRFLSLLCVLALCLGLLPVTALAAETNTVYVGGEALAGSSDSIAYATTNENGEVITEGATADNYNIKWDGNTLTLKGAYITKEVSTPGLSSPVEGAAIGVHNQNGAAELTITLEGTNTIEDVSYGICVLALSTGSANLTITGSGSLDVSATSPGIRIQSHSGDAAVSIKNAKVTATAQWASGVNVRCGTNSSASLTVNGGNLTSSGSQGILYDTLESSIPSTIKFIVSNSAIVDARGGGIGAGYIGNLSGVSPTDDSVGIVFGHDRSDSKAGTVYGDVTLQEDLEIGEGESLTLDDGANLSAGDHNVIVDGGTLDESLANSLGDRVKYAPAITTQPTSQTVTEGGTATFTVVTSGTEPLSYQWQQSTDSGQSWTNIDGATDATYTTEATTTSMNGYQYRCVVSNSAGSITSDAVSLTVNEHVHTWGNPVWNWSEDGKTCTVTFACEKDETHKETPVVKVTSAVKKPATCTETGVTTYTATVEFNGQTYTDTKDVADLPATGHSYDDGKCTVCGAIASDFKVIITAGANGIWQKGTKDGLTFTSNAAYKYFQKVQVDGKDLDVSNYTVKEGSTIVTLKAEYLETLSVGKHTLAIVSETGTATTEFTVKAAAVTDDTQSPQTGDDSNIALWIAVLLAAGTALTGTAVYSRKRKYSK